MMAAILGGLGAEDRVGVDHAVLVALEPDGGPRLGRRLHRADRAGDHRPAADRGVLASLFGAIAAPIARVLFAERLAGPQVTGITVTIAGVVALGVLHA